MKNFKYNLQYFKKNFNVKNFVRDIDKLSGTTDQFLITEIIWYTAFENFYDNKAKEYSDEWYAYGQIVIDNFYKKKNIKFRQKIHRYEYDGTLLPNISDNFSLEWYFDFGVKSHALIRSKINNKYIHLFCLRHWDQKKNKPINNISIHHIEKIFKKKINKKDFFKHIINLDKKNKQFMIIGADTYKSTNGVDYYDLYINGKL
tara:strand:- start:61 stop:666 length:606 start_codon:yes stop_codon:yes gene_type:complete